MVTELTKFCYITLTDFYVSPVLPIKFNFCKQNSVLRVNFLKIRTNFCLSSQAFACLQHGFLRTVENVYIHNFVTPKWCMGKYLYMEQFENQAINTAPHPPLFWRRFVDDTFTILLSSHKTSFLEHLNSIDEHIQFTSEEADNDGAIHFLDVLIIPDEEGNLKTLVYRTPTYTDLHLQWDSNHSFIQIWCGGFTTTQS